MFEPVKVGAYRVLVQSVVEAWIRYYSAISRITVGLVLGILGLPVPKGSPTRKLERDSLPGSVVIGEAVMLLN